MCVLDTKIDFLFQEPSYIKTSTMSTQTNVQEYIKDLVQNETKLNLEEFFTDIPGAKRRRRRRLKDFILIRISVL